MINFKPAEPGDRKLYEQFLFDNDIKRGCEYSFTNLFIWGQQNIATVHNQLVRLSHYGKATVYSFPLGKGDKKAALDEIIDDAKERGIPCRFSGIYEEDKDILEKLYPNMFRFSKNDGSFDYVYDIDKLADLSGRKYHSKRNHIHRFRDLYPNCTVEPISESLLPSIKEFADSWYEHRLATEPDGDYDLERSALEKAITHYRELEMEGLVLLNSGEILAFTMGSRMHNDTFDVHFEKAKADIQGAYTVINCEFAKHIRSKYPEIKLLDREEDMGIEGLRKAKLSYRPHHMIEKFWAHPTDGIEFINNPQEDQIPQLRALWKEAFGDTDEFLDIFFKSAFSTERCRCITSDGDIAAALYWFDCEFEGSPIAYIYAVATKKSYRGQGLCHKLMEDTHKHLKTLRYEGAILVPGSKELFDLYGSMGYEKCSGVTEFKSTAEEQLISIRELCADEYAELRRNHLPDGGVIQENENLSFLEKQTKLYGSVDFVLAAREEDGILNAVEILGNTNIAPNILHTLGYTEGRFRTFGDDRDFAMYLHIGETKNIHPSYFGLAFD